ncbi:2-dehydro-3-deoxygluconokinase [Microbacterium sp. SORGH_AS 1204]|uniref:sugar kinase n=1 Tax=Microbacterium sp. SORGH_AS_1204 TaxID=3041785 RepID=UPI00278F6233|nr:sugar kinase [Microbacterium sp. SORGH_AS_1204]MDQ1135419.1 2-dehydro-3-deoxygluconokinase [Microbacterium sp. SORGH_AS_1204]
MASVLTFGETMGLVRADDLGGWETVSRASIGVGGADSNVAIGLRRLGVSSAWIGRVGDDALGRRVERDIRGEAVETRVIVDPTRPTGLMLKERRTPAHGRVTFYRRESAGSALSSDDIDDEDIARSRLVLVNGVTASLSTTARETVLSVADRARGLGVLVAFDVNHRPSMWGGKDAQPLYRQIAASSDIVFAGDDEARLLLGGPALSPGEYAAALLALGPSQAVVKSGAAGAVAHEGEQKASAAAVAIDPVDTVGAGDAFVAGYLAALLRGATLSERLALGVQCGAFACLGPGDWESLPRREELALLNSVDPVQR